MTNRIVSASIFFLHVCNSCRDSGLSSAVIIEPVYTYVTSVPSAEMLSMEQIALPRHIGTGGKAF